MYRRRNVRYYRKKPQKISQFQVHNKREAEQALEGLESSHMIAPIDMGRLWLKYTPIKYIFTFNATDMDHYDDIKFYFRDNVYLYLQLEDVDLASATYERNQWFFRGDIQQGYDFVVTKFQCMNIVFNRHNQFGNAIHLGSFYNDWSQAADTVSFSHAIDAECAISLPSYACYGKEIIDTVTQEKIRLYFFWWTLTFRYQMFPLISEAFHYSEMDNQNFNNWSTVNIPDEHPENRINFYLTPGRAPNTQGLTYTRNSHMEFILFPKGYMHSYIQEMAKPIIIDQTETP